MFGRVAVITRTKNRPLLLNRCIQSVLSQKFESWSHVIVNDGGHGDEVDAIVASYASRYAGRVEVIHLECPRGMEAASNAGLDASRSPLITFLDDDDTWHPTFLSEMTGLLSEAISDRIKGIVCQTEIVTETVEKEGADTWIETSRHILNPELSSVSLFDMVISNKFTNNAFLYDRSAIEAFGNYNESLPALGDWDFNLRFLWHFDVVVLGKPLAKWHWRKFASVSDLNSIYSTDDIHCIWRDRLLNDAIRGKWLGDYPNFALIMSLGTKFDELNRVVAELRRELQESSQTHTHTLNELRYSIRDYSFLHQMRRAATKWARGLCFRARISERS